MFTKDNMFIKDNTFIKNNYVPVIDRNNNHSA